MPKSLPTSVIAQINAQQKRPVLLFELGLTSTIRFAAHITNVTFPTGGTVYTAKGIFASNPKQSVEGQIERIRITFDNVSRDMTSYANNEDFRGKSIIIKRIYLDDVGDGSRYNEIFNGIMEQPDAIDAKSLSVPATIGKPLNRKCLALTYQRMCPWKFGSDECNTDGNAILATLTVTGTADSGTTTTLVDNALTQPDDHWNCGRIEITKSGVMYYRKVLDFKLSTGTITLDVGLSFSIDNTCTYVVYKGCDQTYDTCLGNNVWGPSADNSLNFGGCIHISKQMLT